MVSCTSTPPVFRALSSEHVIISRFISRMVTPTAWPETSGNCDVHFDGIVAAIRFGQHLVVVDVDLQLAITRQNASDIDELTVEAAVVGVGPSGLNDRIVAVVDVACRGPPADAAAVFVVHEAQGLCVCPGATTLPARSNGA